MSLYETLKAAGCEVDNHESDLHVKATATATLILKRFPEWRGVSSFCSRLDGALWYDVPFAYQPWWDGRLGGGQ
jgi:hypothetical protein